jgi:hypothetical protein
MFLGCLEFARVEQVNGDKAIALPALQSSSGVIFLTRASDGVIDASFKFHGCGFFSDQYGRQF